MKGLVALCFQLTVHLSALSLACGSALILGRTQLGCKFTSCLYGQASKAVPVAICTTPECFPAEAGRSARVDANRVIQNLLKPLDNWPSPQEFLQYLTRPDGRKIPVSELAFAKVWTALSQDNFQQILLLQKL